MRVTHEKAVEAFRDVSALARLRVETGAEERALLVRYRVCFSQRSQHVCLLA